MKRELRRGRPFICFGALPRGAPSPFFTNICVDSVTKYVARTLICDKEGL